MSFDLPEEITVHLQGIQWIHDRNCACHCFIQRSRRGTEERLNRAVLTHVAEQIRNLRERLVKAQAL